MADVAATIAALDALGVRVHAALRQATADTAHLFQASGMDHAPVGVAGNSTNAPGDLRRSIDVEGPVGEGGEWVARVGPTVIYGRQRELGGPIYPKVASALAFTKFGQRWVIGPGIRSGVGLDGTFFVRRAGVYQAPNPYMHRAYNDTEPKVEPVVVSRLAAALEEA